MPKRNNSYRWFSRKNNSAKPLPGRSFKSLFRVGGFLGLIILVSLVLMGGYHWLTTASFLSLKSIVVQGNRVLKEETVKSRAGVNLGQNSLALSIGQIEDRLIKQPWIDRVAVRRELPDRLFIKVWEKKPMFWVKKQDKLYYASSSGEIIAKVKKEHFLSLPLLHFDPGQTEQKNCLQKIGDLFNQNNYPFNLAEVAWISITAAHIVEFFLHQRSILLRISSSNLASNCRCLNLVWDDLDQRGELSEVKRILVYDRMCWVKKAESAG